MASNKVPVYTPGSLTPEAQLRKIAQQGKPMAQDLIAQETVNDTPEQKADALDKAAVLLKGTQQVLAKTPEPERAAVAQDLIKLQEERAAIAGRGLSTGERIAAAILGAAPLIAAASSKGSDFYGAAAGANQINRGLIDANQQAMKNELAQKDVEIGMAQERQKEGTRVGERGEDWDRSILNREDNQEHERSMALLRAQATNDAKPDKTFDEVQKWGRSLKGADAKGIENAQKALSTSEQLEELLTGPQQAGFNDLTAMVKFIQSLDGSVVRADDRAAFESAKGLFLKTNNLKNKMVGGEQLGPEGRKYLLEVQRLLGRTAAKQINAVMTPSQLNFLKEKRGWDDNTIQAAKDFAIGGMTPYKQRLLDEAMDAENKKGSKKDEKPIVEKSYENMTVEELKALKAKRGL